MSATNVFPPELLKQPPQVRLAYFKDKTIAHPGLVAVDRTLGRAIHEPAGASVILVVGPTGVGKTTLRLRTQQRLMEEALPELEKDRGRIPVVGMEVVSADSGSFNWRDFYIRALVALEEPLIERKLDHGIEGLRRDGSGQFGVQPRAVAPALRQALEQTLRHRRPIAFFLDEAQHFLKVASGRGILVQADTIKSLASMTGTLFVLIGTYELLGLTNLSAQLNRRIRLIHFPRYRRDSAEDRKRFQSLLHTLQCHMPLVEQPDLLRRWEECYVRSLGCVGVLKNWLTRALAAALEDGQATLGPAYLDRHAESPRILLQMEREMEESEKQLAETKGDRTDLRTLLGVEAEPPASGADRLVTAVNQQPRTAASRPRRRVGQRNPIRDPVGVKRHVG